MKWLFSWEVTSWAFGIFVGIALSVLALDDFKLAKAFFLLALADAMGGIVMGVAKSQLSPWVALLTVFIGTGLAGVLGLMSWQYVNRKKEHKEKRPKIAATINTRIVARLTLVQIRF
jgi:uncharacterized membrane protein YidH (DUF202 family)